MLKTGDAIRVIRAPERVLREQLASPPSLVELATKIVVPAILVRSVAVLLRSLAMSAPRTGIVLSLNNLAMQLGTWMAASLLLPALARQLGVQLNGRAAALIVAFASIPLWLAGALYVVPESAPFLFYWSRSLVVAVAFLGVYIAYRAVQVLELPSEARPLLLGGLIGMYLGVYLVLFVLLGIVSHVVLFIIGAV